MIWIPPSLWLKPEQSEQVQADIDRENNDMAMKELLLVLFMVKLGQTKEGLKVIETLGKEFLRGIFDTLHALGQASAANQVTAWANPFLVSLILERFGFIYRYDMKGFTTGLSVISGAKVVESYLDTIQGLFPFGKPEPSEYPSNIVYSARGNGGTSIEAKNVDVETVRQLRSILSEKP